MAITLLEAGFAKLQTSFGSDRIPDFHLLERAEQSARSQKLKVRSSHGRHYLCNFPFYCSKVICNADLGELC